MVNIGERKRWKIMDQILLISLGIIVLFAWFDSQNIIGIKEIDAAWWASGGTSTVWNTFWSIMSPALFTMWILVLAAVGLIWYVITRDKSEALALFLTPASLIYFGTQDLIYYVISPDKITESVGCWADVMLPVRIVSDVLGEVCPTATTMIISGGIGMLTAYSVYKYLKKQKW